MSAEMKERAGAQSKKGEARCPGAPSTQKIIEADKVAAPSWVRSESYRFLGDEDIPKDRYIDPAYAKKEFETLWNRTWQFACREEHIPEVGDYHVYDIGAHSFIVTRVAKNEVKAYYNACLHRGTKLRGSGSDGHATEFRCSFHGWSWNIDGTNKGVVCQWDFPHVDRGKFSLPQARVGRLGGFVFINMDPAAPALADYLGAEALSPGSAGSSHVYLRSHVSAAGTARRQAARAGRAHRARGQTVIHASRGHGPGVRRHSRPGYE